MVVSVKMMNAIGMLMFLMICSTGNVIIQSFFILTMGLYILLFKGIDSNKNFNTFYIGLLLISAIQLLFFWREDYKMGFVINTILMSFMWFLAFLGHNFIANSVKKNSVELLEKMLNYFFKLNILLVIMQYILVCFEAKTIFPFSVPEFGMSTGDYIKGFFSNSSVNMVIMTFYAVYFYSKKKIFKTTISVIILVLTTYMSGIILAIGVIILYAFFLFSFKNKIKTIAIVLLGFYVFTVVSPENVKYVKAIFVEKINSKDDPARKVVSFEQTAANFVSSPASFLFGEGGGKFSSRTAYLTGGDYVNWYPKSLVYRSDKFHKNHFQLWNKKALSIPYRDGTANQPFSFYNKIVGEYGLLGIMLFYLYLSYFFKRYSFLTYGKLILPLLLVFFILDYWFEYFTVILFFELFMLLDIKANKEIEERSQENEALSPQT
jgi:hypothetical protein